jgi:hypothetical protein
MDKFERWYKNNEWKFCKKYIVVLPDKVKMNRKDLKKLQKRDEYFLSRVKEVFRSRNYGQRKPLVGNVEKSNGPATVMLPFSDKAFRAIMFPHVPFKGPKAAPQRYAVHEAELARQKYESTYRFKTLQAVKRALQAIASMV